MMKIWKAFFLLLLSFSSAAAEHGHARAKGSEFEQEPGRAKGVGCDDKRGGFTWVSKSQVVVSAPVGEIDRQVLENEKLAETGLFLEPPLRFLNERDQEQFFSSVLRLPDQRHDVRLPVRIWRQLSPSQKRSVSECQTRDFSLGVQVCQNGHVVSLATLLPPRARALLHRFPFDAPGVAMPSMREIYKDLAPDRLPGLSAESGDEPLYPQCYAAVLDFHGLQQTSRVFYPREVLLSERQFGQALGDLLQQNRFVRVPLRSMGELQFGDVLITRAHAAVYVGAGIIFERYTGGRNDAWRLAEDTEFRSALPEGSLVVWRAPALPR